MVRAACWDVQVRARDDMGAISFGHILECAVKSRDDQDEETNRQGCMLGCAGEGKGRHGSHQLWD